MEYALVVVWWVVALALAVAALPVAALLFPRAADRGAGLALPLALATFGVVGYWVGQVAFGWPAVIAALVVLFAGMAYGLWREVEVRLDRFRDVAVVFTLAFALLVAARAVDPSAYPVGGEKFLDLGLLSSLLRAESLPPEDMWFAGEPVGYYYGGQMISAMLARLTTTEAAYAYNLALATFYAAYVSAAYGLAGAVAAARDRSYRAAGAAAAVLVGVASNLSTPIRALGWLLPEPYGGELVRAFGLWVVQRNDAGQVVDRSLAVGPEQFSVWDASRVIPGTINEFPFFAFLNGDLHAHMLSTPFMLLVAALAFAYYRTPAAELRRRRVLLALIAPVGGLIAVVNMWSFPAVGGLTWLALALAPASPWSLFPASIQRAGTRLADALPPAPAPVREGLTAAERARARRELARPVVAAVAAAGVVALAAVVAAPFLLGSAPSRPVDWVLPGRRTGLGGLLVVHGGFLLAVVAFVRSRLSPAPKTVLAGTLWVAAGIVVAAPETLLAVPLFVPVVVLGWYLLRRDRAGFETLLVVGGAGLVVLVEFVHVVEYGGESRLNTVFKTYAQVWALWGVGAGVMLADATRLADGWAALRARLAGASPPALGRGDAVRASLGALLLVSLSVYGGLALGAQFTTDGPALSDPTLDARNVLTGDPEAEAIAWLDSLEGQPTVLTAPGWAYDWAGAPSSFTGVPTVVGWEHHVGRYHGFDVAAERADDVDAMFTGNATPRAELLAAYDVRYVYVGPTEREQYGAELATFADEPGITQYRQFGPVTVYRVDQSALSA